jgi:hypothetical protein
MLPCCPAGGPGAPGSIEDVCSDLFPCVDWLHCDMLPCCAAGGPGAPGSSVGYHVRLDAAVTNNTQLLFCTTGILLRRWGAHACGYGIGAVACPFLCAVYCMRAAARDALVYAGLCCAHCACVCLQLRLDACFGNSYMTMAIKTCNKCAIISSP